MMPCMISVLGWSSQSLTILTKLFLHYFSREVLIGCIGGNGRVLVSP